MPGSRVGIRVLRNHLLQLLQFFIYTAAEQSAALCRGWFFHLTHSRRDVLGDEEVAVSTFDCQLDRFGFGRIHERLCELLTLFAQVVGVKPASVALLNRAVLTNQQALCPSSRVRAEYERVASVDDAHAKCNADPGCSHFTWHPASSRLQLW